MEAARHFLQNVGSGLSVCYAHSQVKELGVPTLWDARAELAGLSRSRRGEDAILGRHLSFSLKPVKRRTGSTIICDSKLQTWLDIFGFGICLFGAQLASSEGFKGGIEGGSSRWRTNIKVELYWPSPGPDLSLNQTIMVRTVF